jgi:putative membrane protein
METAVFLASQAREFGAAGGWWWPIFPLLWFALIAGALFFFGSRMRRGAQQYPFQSGEAVLAERYARGEVTEEEYRERLEVLRQRRQ